MLKWFITPVFFLLNLQVLFSNDPINSRGLFSHTGTIKITFVNVVKGLPMLLQSKIYTNSFGEDYSINKFKYYIGGCNLAGSKVAHQDSDSYHLVNESDTASLSFIFTAEEGIYDSVFFLLGVDSLYNVSGAQTGDLDPANDMFWTWNSGYVMAKMEGRSSSSALNNIFEFHIGGFAGRYSVLKNIALPLAPGKLVVHKGSTSEVIIQADADAWWQSPNDIRLSNSPAITTPGIMAKKISDNYSKMFSVKSVSNH